MRKKIENPPLLRLRMDVPTAIALDDVLSKVPERVEATHLALSDDQANEAFTAKKNQQHTKQDNRCEILNEYNGLLREGKPFSQQSENFREFYLKYRSSFDQMQNLNQQLEEENFLLRENIPDFARKQAFMDNLSTRGKGFFANLRYHSEYANDNWAQKNNNYVRSMAIAVLARLGPLCMVFGGLTLIVTFGTPLFYLSVGIIAFGAMLTAMALVLSCIDQRQAIKTYQNLENSKTMGKSFEEQTKDCKSRMLQIWNKIESIDFVESNVAAEKSYRLR